MPRTSSALAQGEQRLSLVSSTTIFCSFHSGKQLALILQNAARLCYTISWSVLERGEVEEGSPNISQVGDHQAKKDKLTVTCLLIAVAAPVSFGLVWHSQSDKTKPCEHSCTAGMSQDLLEEPCIYPGRGSPPQHLVLLHGAQLLVRADLLHSFT